MWSNKEGEGVRACHNKRAKNRVGKRVAQFLVIFLSFPVILLGMFSDFLPNLVSSS